MQITRLRGSEIIAAIPALTALRLAVFREYPYLYDGTEEYEAEYLAHYAACPDSLVVLAKLDGEVLGATTAQPLQAAQAEWQQAFAQHSWPVRDILYFGESLVLAPHRGKGLGVAFFAEREAHARALGLTYCCFCAVQRPADHPQKPAHYQGNEAFWARRGYAPLAGVIAHYEWPDVGDTASTTKSLPFWGKAL